MFLSLQPSSRIGAIISLANLARQQDAGEEEAGAAFIYQGGKQMKYRE
jgi:hypothetical protein